MFFDEAGVWVPLGWCGNDHPVSVMGEKASATMKDSVDALARVPSFGAEKRLLLVSMNTLGVMRTNMFVASGGVWPSLGDTGTPPEDDPVS